MEFDLNQQLLKLNPAVSILHREGVILAGQISRSRPAKLLEFDLIGAELAFGHRRSPRGSILSGDSDEPFYWHIVCH